MRRFGKVDLNQGEIVAALRKVGASVSLLSSLGGGIPDLLVGFRGTNHLMEVKSAGGTLTQDQVVFHDTWRGARPLVTFTTEEALCQMGLS